MDGRKVVKFVLCIPPELSIHCMQLHAHYYLGGALLLASTNSREQSYRAYV